MIHSEVTEALEAYRKDKGQAEIAEELVDILIRVLDLYVGAQNAGIIANNLDDVMLEKTNFNATRPEMHGVLG